MKIRNISREWTFRGWTFREVNFPGGETSGDETSWGESSGSWIIRWGEKKCVKGWTVRGWTTKEVKRPGSIIYMNTYIINKYIYNNYIYLYMLVCTTHIITRAYTRTTPIRSLYEQYSYCRTSGNGVIGIMDTCVLFAYKGMFSWTCYENLNN